MMFGRKEPINKSGWIVPKIHYWDAERSGTLCGALGLNFAWYVLTKQMLKQEAPVDNPMICKRCLMILESRNKPSKKDGGTK